MPRSPRRRLRLVVLVPGLLIPLGLVGALVWWLGFGGIERSMEHAWSERLGLPGRIDLADARLAGVGALELDDWRLATARGDLAASAGRIGVESLEAESRYRAEIHDFALHIERADLAFWARLAADIDRLRKRLPSDVVYDVTAAGGSVELFGQELLRDFAATIHRDPARGTGLLTAALAGEPLRLAASVAPPHAGPLVIDELELTRGMLLALAAAGEVVVPERWVAALPERIDLAGSSVQGGADGAAEWEVRAVPSGGVLPLAAVVARGGAGSCEVTLEWSAPAVAPLVLVIEWQTDRPRLRILAGELPVAPLLRLLDAPAALALLLPARIAPAGTQVTLTGDGVVAGTLAATWARGEDEGRLSANAGWSPTVTELSELRFADPGIAQLVGSLSGADGTWTLRWSAGHLAATTANLAEVALAVPGLASWLNGEHAGHLSASADALTALQLNRDEGEAAQEFRLGAVDAAGRRPVTVHARAATLLPEPPPGVALPAERSTWTGSAGPEGLSLEAAVVTDHLVVPGFAPLAAERLRLVRRGRRSELAAFTGEDETWRVSIAGSEWELDTSAWLGARLPGWQARARFALGPASTVPRLLALADFAAWDLISVASWQAEAGAETAFAPGEGLVFAGRFHAGRLQPWPGHPGFALAGVGSDGPLRLAPSAERRAALVLTSGDPTWSVDILAAWDTDSGPRLQTRWSAASAALLAAETTWLAEDAIDADEILVIEYRVSAGRAQPVAALRFDREDAGADAGLLDPSDGDELHRFARSGDDTK